MILLPAFVAGFTRVLMRQRPGIMKIRFFFTSPVAMVTRLSMMPAHCLAFNPCSLPSARAADKAPFVIALAPFIAFMAFIFFITMVATKDNQRESGRESA